MTGSAVIGVGVGSSLPGPSGSSLGVLGTPSPETKPWFSTEVVLAGRGLSMVTRNVRVALPPLPGMVPKATATVASPAVLPVVTEPWLGVTLPTTRVVLVPGVSVKTTLAAS